MAYLEVYDDDDDDDYYDYEVSLLLLAYSASIDVPLLQIKPYSPYRYTHHSK
jgi:hypothetical protein